MKKIKKKHNHTPWRASSHFFCNLPKAISPPKQSKPTPELLQMSPNTSNQQIESQEVVKDVLEMMIS